MTATTIASRVTGLLRSFNEAGVLVAADIQVARCLVRLAECDDELVSLAAALAVRAPRLGHTCVDLDAIRETADTDTDTPVDIASLPWPETSGWLDRLRASNIVGEDLPSASKEPGSISTVTGATSASSQGSFWRGRLCRQMRSISPCWKTG